MDGQYAGLPIGELSRASGSPNRHTLATPERVLPSLKTLMQEFVVPLSDGSRAVFQWPTLLSREDVADLKDSLKIVERKITRSTTERLEQADADQKD